MNGNGELTESENVIFYVSYGVFTEFLRMNVIRTYFCNGNGSTARIRNAGNQALQAIRVSIITNIHGIVALCRSRTRKMSPIYTRFITTSQIATHDYQSGLSRANAVPELESASEMTYIVTGGAYSVSHPAARKGHKI